MSLDIGLNVIKEVSVVDKNITHNVVPMWKEAGIYDALYNSEGKLAKEVMVTLIDGLTKMLKNPKKFKVLNAENGWGTYENAIKFLQELIAEFAEYPEGKIWISK